MATDEGLLSWCKRMIACRSVTGEGTRTIAEMCARELLGPRGIEARLIASARESDSQVNVVATIKGREGNAAPLLLNTHLDTVPPGDTALWTECAGDPFSATISDGRIYGLGAADTKLDFVAKVMALAEVRRPRRTVYLLATFGEEHGLVGAKEIVEAQLVPRGALAFVGEPSHLEVITAHKGLMVFELHVRFEPERCEAPAAMRRLTFGGRAAHSSTPALGRNAICAALNALAANQSLRVATINGGDAVNKVPAQCAVSVHTDEPPSMPAGGQVETLQDRADAFVPAQVIVALSRFVAELQKFADNCGPTEPDYAAPTLTCNPGVVRSSNGTVALEFELRPPPSLALDTIRDGVEKIVEGLEVTFPDFPIEVAERRANPGFRSAFEGETVEIAMAALANAGLPLASGVKAGCTEAGIFAAAGLRPVVFGPGPSTGVIHAPNEYNLLAEVEGASRFYRELIRL